MASSSPSSVGLETVEFDESAEEDDTSKDLAWVGTSSRRFFRRSGTPLNTLLSLTKKKEDDATRLTRGRKAKKRGRPKKTTSIDLLSSSDEDIDVRDDGQVASDNGHRPRKRSSLSNEVVEILSNSDDDSVDDDDDVEEIEYDTRAMEALRILRESRMASKRIEEEERQRFEQLEKEERERLEKEREEEKGRHVQYDEEQSTQPQIRIKVRFAAKKDPLTFEMAETDTFDKLICDVCKRLQWVHARIMFDGDILQPSQTPRDVDMEEDDLVEASPVESK